MVMFLFGYDNPTRRLTIDQLNVQTTWKMLHTEVRRRLLALFLASGYSVGIGGGYRPPGTQAKEFVKRHHVVPGPTALYYDGKYWALNDGASPLAPPGLSYHEATLGGYALAADLVGDVAWANAHGAEFGLRDFRLVGAPGKQEPWHFQPIEIPTSRSDYDPTKDLLTTWGTEIPVPPQPKPPGETMLIVVGDKDNKADPRRWVWNGVSIHYVKDEGEFATLKYLFSFHPTFSTLASPYWMTQAEMAEYGSMALSV